MDRAYISALHITALSILCDAFSHSTLFSFIKNVVMDWACRSLGDFKFNSIQVGPSSHQKGLRKIHFSRVRSRLSSIRLCMVSEASLKKEAENVRLLEILILKVRFNVLTSYAQFICMLKLEGNQSNLYLRLHYFYKNIKTSNIFKLLLIFLPNLNKF